MMNVTGLRSTSKRDLKRIFQILFQYQQLHWTVYSTYSNRIKKKN